jgi:hypothetical protein
MRTDKHAGLINVLLTSASVENETLNHCAISVNKCQNMVHLVMKISPVQSGGLCELYTSGVSSPYCEIRLLVLATTRAHPTHACVRTSRMRSYHCVCVCVCVGACVRGWWLWWLKY